MLLKMLLPKSLFGRGLLIVALPVILIQLVTAYFFYSRHWENVTRHRTSAFAGEVAFIAYLMANKDDIPQDTVLYLFREHTDIGATYKPNMVLGRDDDGPNFPELDEFLKQKLVMPFTIELENDQIIIRIQLSEGVLQLAASAKRLESPTTTIFLIGMTSASFVLLCIALLFLRNQVRPIRHLAEVAERFGKGLDIEDFKPSGALEVRRAGRAFLVMRERIQRQIRTRTEMLDGISHDLRTPLTRMKLQLAMSGNVAEVAELQEDVSQMETMLNEYLDYARGSEGEEPTACSLNELLGAIVTDYKRTQANIALINEDEVLTEIRINAFRRMMHNIIDNALRHGKCCELSLRKMAGKVDVIIDDDGPGIAPNQREEVFRPFMRLDSARNLNKGGVGLGLTIARDIAMKSGGNIMLSDSPLGGLRVVVRLPL